MELEFWILQDDKWLKVEQEEYYEFTGKKQICAKGRGPGWFEMASILAAFGGRTLH